MKLKKPSAINGNIGLHLNKISIIKGHVNPPNRQKKLDNPKAVTFR